MKVFRKFLTAFPVFIFLSITGVVFAQTVAPEDKTKVAKVEIPIVETASVSESAAPTDLSSNVTESTPTFISARIGVQSDDAIPMTLDDAIRRALLNNNDVEISRTDVRIQEMQLRSLLGIYDPVFSIAPNLTRNSTTGSSATNDFRTNTAVAKQLNQGGGNYRFFFDNSRTENRFAQQQISSGTSGGSGAIYNSSLGITYTQPLLRNFRVDNSRRQIRIQRKRLQQSDADFRRTTIGIISQVQRAYWDLVFALRDQQNKASNLNLARENLRRVEASISAGRSAPLERAEVSTELANREVEVLAASQQVSISENTLKTLLLKDPLSNEWGKPILPTDKPVIGSDTINLDAALKNAIENRFELRRLRLQREINSEDIRYFKNQTKPQIDFTSTFSLDGLSQGGASTSSLFVSQFTGNEEILRQKLNTLLSPANQIPNPLLEIPGTPRFLAGGYNRAWRNIFRSDAPNFSVGMTISFPFRNRTARANLTGAEIQQEQIAAQTRSQEQLIIAEVRNAVQAVETARQRVVAARRGRENAEIQLQGERKLYDAGRSTTFILFQRENALTNARNAEIRAETDYNKALADVQRATSTTFLVNNIEVVSPMTER